MVWVADGAWAKDHVPSVAVTTGARRPAAARLCHLYVYHNDASFQADTFTRVARAVLECYFVHRLC
jgi:hypothetical protein